MHNNGGDLGKLFNMNINNNNSNLEQLMIENNNILRSKNLSVNNVNKFNVSSKNISIVRGR
jgi:sporulation protein YlmC with PRC-barrel domain